MSKILRIDSDNFESKELEPCISILRKGGVIAYPTETVYGLGADVNSETGLSRIYKIKGRQSDKPVSIMISSLHQLRDLTEGIKDYVELLMNRFWPGPLTLILNARQNIHQGFRSKDNKIGIRYPDHKLSRELVQLLGSPITSTSANLSGMQPAINAGDVVNNLGDTVDLIIDSGECSYKKPSTVVDVTGSKPTLLREGAIAFSQILQCTGRFK